MMRGRQIEVTISQRRKRDSIQLQGIPHARTIVNGDTFDFCSLADDHSTKGNTQHIVNLIGKNPYQPSLFVHQQRRINKLNISSNLQPKNNQLNCKVNQISKDS